MSNPTISSASRPMQLVPGQQQATPGPQQTLNQFYTAAQKLVDRIDKTPGLRDKLDDDLQVAEFMSSLDKIAKLEGSEDDVTLVQSFLSNNLKMSGIGDADGKVGPKLVQALQQAFGPISRYSPPPIPVPVPRPPGLGTYPVYIEPNKTVVTFPDRPSTLPANGTTPVSNTAPVTAGGSRSAEASQVIADISRVISAHSGSPGGKCYAGVKNILSQLDKIGHAAEAGPKSKEYKQLLARYPQLKPTLEKLTADPQLAEAVRKGQMLFPPNSGSAYMARSTFDAPDSPYRMVSEGSNDSVDDNALLDPKRFPAGAVIVWDRSPLIEQSKQKGPDGKPTKEAKAALTEIASLRKHGQWKKPGYANGHIAVIGGNGREYSDRNYSFGPHYGGGSFKVYVLK